MEQRRADEHVATIPGRECAEPDGLGGVEVPEARARGEREREGGAVGPRGGRERAKDAERGAGCASAGVRGEERVPGGYAGRGGGGGGGERGLRSVERAGAGVGGGERGEEVLGGGNDEERV